MNNNSTSFNSSPHAYSDIKRLLDELIKSNREIQKELKKFLPHATLLDGWFPATYVKEMLGISSSTLHRYMNDGTLPYSKIGFRTLSTRTTSGRCLNGTIAEDNKALVFDIQEPRI